MKTYSNKNFTRRLCRLSLCNLSEILTSLIIFLAFALAIRYVNALTLTENAMMGSISLGALLKLFVTSLSPILSIVASIVLAFITRSLLVGIISFIPLASETFRGGELIYRLVPTFKYVISLVLILILIALVFFLSLYLLSQIIGGYQDSLLVGARYKANKAIASSLALSALSVEVFNRLGLWGGGLTNYVFNSLSVILTVVEVLLLNNVLLALVLSGLSGLGWPITFLTSLILTQQPSLGEVYLKGDLCLPGVEVVGISRRVPSNRSLLKSTSMRWSLRSFEYAKKRMLCISRGSKKLLIHLYGENARDLLIRLSEKLRYQVLCLDCEYRPWLVLGNPLKVTPDTIDMLEKERSPLIVLESPLDYLYSVVVALSKLKDKDNILVIDGVESILFNTKLLRAVTLELLKVFDVVIMISDVVDYYIISDHVLRFPNTQSLYMIGNAKNRRVLREVLRDYLDSYVIEDALNKLNKDYFILFPVDDKALLITFSSASHLKSLNPS
jgi:hypothetical protein